MASPAVFVAALFVAFVAVSTSRQCEVRARTRAGWVCGAKRLAQDGSQYASFRGVPYAKQPLGELRFQELQPHEPWTGDFNATTEGPACPNNEVLFYALVRPQGISEACIHANIHVPIDALPNIHTGASCTGRLPILVFVHGGAWVSGSGDADIHGPEYLVSRGLIIITFNYRLDFLGFLSLNTPKIPGNNGLRDMVTLLRWVQANAAYFGGNPADVTLAGLSAGAASAHLLTLSPAAAGLFNRAFLMSGVAVQSFYSASPVYAQLVAGFFLSALNITSTDYDEVHDQLVELPIDVLIAASRVVIDTTGLTSFVPVVETPYANFTTILSEYPETLQANGNGKHIPLVIGFTSNECETVRPRLVQVDIVAAIQENPLFVLSPELVYSFPSNVTAEMANKVLARYFRATPTMDEYIKLCTETLFQYPAIKLAQARAASGGAPAFLYKYAYEADYSVVKESLNLTFSGAGHYEDFFRIFKVNSWPVLASNADEAMTGWMTDIMETFIKNNSPSRDGCWGAASCALEYNYIAGPATDFGAMSCYDQEMVHFFESLTNV
ncbi:juvenile hormone esterase-like isoform X1 [Ostrinia furnacalis]|uniref:juvenile hormone esterase-like isoform X1 n=1 Tax=Ostrinia furnacalis TaxID=93504 RepID=UPI0010393946|nr:juvenile hormone esterase-like isoform X1 [Ostrinia furnacalis]